MTPPNRCSGIILHPTSLPGPDGIGDLGPEAYRWVDFLNQAGCSIWQVLPLGPTGYGDSPYQCFSAFAGNPYLISPALLLDTGLLNASDLEDHPSFPLNSVDYGPVIAWKLKLLDQAFERFTRRPRKRMAESFAQFRSEQKRWLDDFALFMAIKQSLGGIAWGEWPEPVRMRKATAVSKIRKLLMQDIHRHAFRQYLFHVQWNNLKSYANRSGIRIMGDMPLYIAYDSSDCWSHRDLFTVDKKGQLTLVAGVPPDYFSPTGQLWGNPLYRWQVHAQTDYAWWTQRTRSALSLFDYVRIDHFRGFAAYWEVKAGAKTAEHGRWVKGPGARFFKALGKTIKPLPIIAEDLGVITPDVVTLREAFELPGMKILQFAFSGPDNAFLPIHYPTHCVAYTGTHDNDTSLGWYQAAPPTEQDFCRRYLASPGENIAWDFIRAVWSSVANIAMAPMQDILGLDTNARMNYPSTQGGNWSWRLLPGSASIELAESLYEMNLVYDRLKES
ncbi:MAG: 4-alpha-glucanotransferase [Anaerolineaceae bacterium]|nr:4-alpha-glucanotransferase [Anaerolineaceae bacterium]